MENLSIPSGTPPSIFDRADGSSIALGGVAEPPGSIMINSALPVTDGGALSFFVETSDSPEIESGEQSTIVHKFHCDYATAQYYITTLPRGTIVYDQGGRPSRVLSTRITPVPKTGMRGVILTITSEGMAPTFSNPPDEFYIETVDLNPPLDQHPRYSDLTYQQRYIVRNADVTDSPTLASNYENAVNNISSSGGTLVQQLEAQELLLKKRKNIDTFYLAGYKIVWAQYFWTPQIMNPGGYIENPFTSGSVPVQYWSVTGEAGGTNIFSNTTTYNGNMYPEADDFTGTTDSSYGLSWQRQADTQQLNRTWWKLTHTWLGGPIGHWDNELYNSSFQPYQTEEDQGAVPTDNGNE